MAKRRKHDPSQLPLMCIQCGGAIDIFQKGSHVISRCQSCRAAAILLVIATREPTDEAQLVEIEHMLLEQVSEMTRSLYEKIREMYLESGYAPSMRELQSAMGWSAHSKVNYHLKVLVDIGLIEREFASARAIKLRYAA
jgi:hypothetical protein